jgi:hypothetical protein
VNRKRMLAVAASASIALTGVAAAPAGAKGSHWSNEKCVKNYIAWSKKHFHGATNLTAKQNREASKRIARTERQHHCVIGG